MKRLLMVFGLLLVPLMIMSGCGGGGSDVSSSTSGTVSEALSKTGSLTISASFPQDGETGEIGTALIDENTYTITVSVSSYEAQYYTSVHLTKESPTATITKIPVGKVGVYITTKDQDDYILDYLNVAGEIVEGNNTLTATLIRGAWDFNSNIILNKTLSSDTTTLNGFSVYPYYYYVAQNGHHHEGVSFYDLLWKGSNIPCQGETKSSCVGELMYHNKFTGPNTNENWIESEDLCLTPSPSYSSDNLDSATQECNSDRKAFIIGKDLEGVEFSDPSILNYSSTVIDKDTIQGYIVETLTKSESSEYSCYVWQDNQWQEANCPFTFNNSGSAAKAAKNELSKAIKKAISQRIGKAEANEQGCFIDLTAEGQDEWTESRWENGSYTIYKIVESWTWIGDACGHPFTAEGRQLPETDLEIIVQNK